MDAKTLESIKLLAGGYKAVLDVAAELERIGSLDRARQEADARRVAAVKEADSVSARLETAKADLAAANNDVESAVLNAGKLADEIAGKANEAAKRVLDEAKKYADDIKATARADAAQTTAKAERDANELIRGAGARRDDIVANANRLVEDAVKVETAKLASERQKEEREFAVRIGVAQAKLDEITSKIAKARNAAKAMLE